MENGNQQNRDISQQAPINPVLPIRVKKFSKKIIVAILLAVIVGVVSWIALSRQPKTDLSPIVVNHKTETATSTKTKAQNFRYLTVGEVLEWTENTKWNFDPADTFITYSDPSKGFSFEIPYNDKWGNDEIKLKPYDETTEGVIYFGNATVDCEGSCGLNRDIHFFTKKALDAEKVIEEETKKWGDILFPQPPKVVHFNGLEAIEYEVGELGTKKFVIVIGKKFNYVFSARNVEIKDLEQIAKTVNF